MKFILVLLSLVGFFICFRRNKKRPVIKSFNEIKQLYIPFENIEEHISCLRDNSSLKVSLEGKAYGPDEDCLIECPLSEQQTIFFDYKIYYDFSSERKEVSKSYSNMIFKLIVNQREIHVEPGEFLVSFLPERFFEDSSKVRKASPFMEKFLHNHSDEGRICFSSSYILEGETIKVCGVLKKGKEDRPWILTGTEEYPLVIAN